MNKPLRMYFLCIHNRWRSQMAEAFANHYAGDKVSVSRAGVEESAIHLLTIEVMKEVGIDISDQLSQIQHQIRERRELKNFGPYGI